MCWLQSKNPGQIPLPGDEQKVALRVPQMRPMSMLTAGQMLDSTRKFLLSNRLSQVSSLGACYEFNFCADKLKPF